MAGDRESHNTPQTQRDTVIKSNGHSRRNMNFESMEKRELLAADLGMDLGLATEPASTDNVAEIDFVEVAGGEAEVQPVCYLKYKLERAFIKSWSTSGDADDAEPTQAAIFVKIPPIRGEVTSEGYNDADYFVADSFSFGVEREMKESGEKGGTEDINIGVGELQECTISKSMDVTSMSLAQYAINGNSSDTAEGQTGSDLLIVNNGDGSDFLEGQDGSDLLIVNNGDGSDFSESGRDAYFVKVDSETTTQNANDYFVADSFSFGVEREMKESGEKGGTEDINIGVGELQECSNESKVDEAIKSWSTSGDADDRPTEEVAFYFNKIAF